MPGMIHHVMCRGVGGMEIFRDNLDRDDLLRRLSVLTGEDRLQLYAFSLMPNHFHLLVRPLSLGLPTFMSRLLTGFSGRFNLRAKRHGHVFQDRYKSIVVEEERYLLELIRYIHLNPIRAGIIGSLSELASWPYTGHATLLGQNKRPWIESDETLQHFSKTLLQARRILIQFMKDGLSVDDASGFANMPIDFSSATIGKKHTPIDDRILGSSKFVKEILSGLHNKAPSALQPTHEDSATRLAALIKAVARHCELTVAEMCSGSKRPKVVNARHITIWLGVRTLGLPAKNLSQALHIKPLAVHRVVARQLREPPQEATLIARSLTF